PLYWTRQISARGDWLLFASEVKALLASGLVHARPDLRGIDQTFYFLAMPGPATCFEGVELLQPGHSLTIELGGRGEAARPRPRPVWGVGLSRPRGREGGGHRGGGRAEARLNRAVGRAPRAGGP